MQIGACIAIQPLYSVLSSGVSFHWRSSCCFIDLSPSTSSKLGRGFFLL